MADRMMTATEQIDDFIDTRLNRYIEETAEPCRGPSVSAKADRPVMAECARLVGSILERHGFDVQLFETEGNPIVVGRASGKSDRTLLFYNHYDVQPPEPLELWTSPPFQPTLRDGQLYGRRASDNTGTIAARVAAIKAGREVRGELPCSLKFCIEGDEEIGSPHMEEVVEEHPQRAGARDV